MAAKTIPTATLLAAPVEESAGQQAPQRILEGFVRELLSMRHCYDHGDGFPPALIIDGPHGAGIRVQLGLDEWNLFVDLDPSEEATQ